MGCSISSADKKKEVADEPKPEAWTVDVDKAAPPPDAINESKPDAINESKPDFGPRAVWLWDDATVAETLGEAELDGPAPTLNGKQLLLGEGDWAEGDKDKAMEMLNRVCLMFMEDMAMSDGDA